MANSKNKSKLEKNSLSSSSTTINVRDTHTEELVFGLCGPIGSPLHEVSAEIQSILVDQFGYECRTIKLSKFIEENKGNVRKEPRFQRVQELIDKGNALRDEHGKSILVDFAIHEIALDREKNKMKSGAGSYKSRRVCHVIDSIKNQEELEALRVVYGDMFFFIGVFSPILVREKKLKDMGMELKEVYQLIDRDSGEEVDYGQTVEGTFPKSDFFLRVDSESLVPVKSKLERFLKIIFGVEISTPSSGEKAMYLASSAAGNSACLSRQVGAAVTDDKGEIISLGWNDVPKFGGNLYQYSPEEDLPDHRCMNRGQGLCSNDEEKNKISQVLVNELIDKGLIAPDKSVEATSVILGSKIKTLIEFSRSVHAEMHAIITGSKLAGEKMIGGKLYCTTYPCHSCARHIVASGITEVYFIEPYRKSLATKLHGDSITESEVENSKVKLLPFDGVAPTRYLELFRMGLDSRKNSSGKKIKKDPKTAQPIYEVPLEAVPALEGIVTNSLKAKNLIEA